MKGRVYISAAANVHFVEWLTRILRSDGYDVTSAHERPIEPSPRSLGKWTLQDEINFSSISIVIWDSESLNSDRLQLEARLASQQAKLFQILIGVEAPPSEFADQKALRMEFHGGGVNEYRSEELLSEIEHWIERAETAPMHTGAASAADSTVPISALLEVERQLQEARKQIADAEQRARAAEVRANEVEKRLAVSFLQLESMKQEAVLRRDDAGGASRPNTGAEEWFEFPSDELPEVEDPFEADIAEPLKPESTGNYLDSSRKAAQAAYSRRMARVEKAEASAFAPRKLQRGSPELVRIFVHPPEQRQAVEKAAKALDANAASAGPASSIGYVQAGAMVDVLLDVKGGKVTPLSTDKPWTGDAIEFVFSVEASESQEVTQAVITARIMVDGAQVGLIAFVRPLSKPKTGSSPQQAVPVREKFRRAKRVFLSYSSADREPVSLVAGAYQRAGIPCFFDRTSLESGEEWSPRLIKEIRRADLFHLFWSRNAASSEWVVKETEHALQKRRASWTKRPNITVQMLDGPPWAPHPPHLNDINFDDFVRAAVVGYARGEE